MEMSSSSNAETTGAPEVTVVIPTTDRWAFLDIAIRAVRMQQDVRAEIVVVVDEPGTSDVEALERYRADGVRVVANAVPQGVAHARNLGIDEARGEWVAFLDDDDIWAPGKLRGQLAAARELDAGFAWSSAVVLERDLVLRSREPAPTPDEMRSRILEHNSVPACSSNMLVRTEVAREVRFVPAFKHFADWDFAIRAVEATTGAACPNEDVGYVWHETNMHSTQLAGIEDEQRRFRAAHAAAGRRLSDDSEFRFLAGCYRQAGQRGKATRLYLRAARRHRSPINLARAAGAGLGERTISAITRTKPSNTGAPPAWLDLYR